MYKYLSHYLLIFQKILVFIFPSSRDPTIPTYVCANVYQKQSLQQTASILYSPAYAAAAPLLSFQNHQEQNDDDGDDDEDWWRREDGRRWRKCQKRTVYLNFMQTFILI